MNLHNLKYFLMVAEEKNITKAAQKLFITQQTLSGAIRRLEEEYQCRFFEREPHIHLTEAGFFMLQFARQVLKMEDHLTNCLDDVSQERRGHLSVGITPTRARLLLPHFLSVFKAKYPRIQLSLQIEGYSRLKELVRSDALDAIIATSHPKETLFQDYVLYEDPFCLILPRPLVNLIMLPKPRKQLYQAAELSSKQLNCIFTQLPLIQMIQSSLEQKSEEIFHREGISPNILYSIHDLETVLELSLHNMGYCFSYAQYAKKKACQFFQEDREKWPVFITFPEKSSQVAVTIKKGYEKRRSIQLLIQELQLENRETMF